jgi:Ca2+-binding RTX toxin-like protein
LTKLAGRSYRDVMRGSVRVLFAGALVCAFAFAWSTVAHSQTVLWSFGTNGPDTLTGTAGDDLICGLDGDDRIDGGAGVDRVFGDGQRSGLNSCNVGSVKNAVGVGNDTLYSGPGSPTAPSRLFGGAGNDVLVGGPDFDLLSGGQDDDEIRDSSGSNGSVRDYLTGNGGDDELVGSPDGDVLSGGDGRNVLKGRAGNDDLFATGKTTYDAGPGDDLVVSRNGRRDRVNCGPGRDKVNADKADLLRNCEKRVREAPLGPGKERPNFGGSPSNGGGGGPR